VCCLDFLSGVLVFISSAFAQTAPAAAAGGDMQSSLMGMLPLVLMFVVLWFVMIRPSKAMVDERNVGPRQAWRELHKAMVESVALPKGTFK
jgi:hypothetical protein